jgi:hypothetical protein
MKQLKCWFLRTVAVYRRKDNIRNRVIRQELNIFQISDKIVEYQIKWLHYMERMDETFAKRV